VVQGVGPEFKTPVPKKKKSNHNKKGWRYGSSSHEDLSSNSKFKLQNHHHQNKTFHKAGDSRHELGTSEKSYVTVSEV
jgi:hypothetical protein